MGRDGVEEAGRLFQEEAQVNSLRGNWFRSGSGGGRDSKRGELRVKAGSQTCGPFAGSPSPPCGCAGTAALSPVSDSWYH